MAAQILIVEDNPDEAELFRAAFDEVAADVGVAVAATAGAALALLAEGEWPRVLVTDHHLPDLSGQELIRLVLAQPRGAQLAVVMLSGDTHAPVLPAPAVWQAKPVTWRAWRACALDLVERHLRGPGA
jgi:CheY-like chemotaxis protein